MRKIRKRVFAAVLAAALLFTMPGMASYAEAEDAKTKDISESVTIEHAEDDAAEGKTEAMQESEAEDSDMDKPGTGEDDTGDTETDAQEPAEDETVPTQKEDAKECTCGTLCTQDSINGDCPVCGTEEVDLSRCKGEKTENSSEENKEDAGQEDAGAQDDSANLCAHHKEHTKDCGYSRASEDGEGSLCTYECRICPIEALIAALPRALTEDNAETVRWQLDEILALYIELTEDEQEQIDMTLCNELLAELNEANAPAPIDEPPANALAKVDVGGTITYVTTVDAFQTAFEENGSGKKITLLDNVEVNEILVLNPNTELTLDCGGFTLSGGLNYLIVVNVGAVLNLVGGKVCAAGSSAVRVNGAFTMSGGVLDTTDSSAFALEVSDSRASVTITGGTVGDTGYGLNANQYEKIALSGGTYSSIYPGRDTTNRPVSGLLDPGYALKGADGFIRGDATGNLRNVEVVRCTHDGAATPNEDGATHGGECPYCGNTIVAEPHTLGADNKCEGCKAELKVQVEIGNTTTYYGGINAAWGAAEGHTATVTLLDHVTVSTPLSVTENDDITFDGGKFTLTGSSNQNRIIYISGGKLTVTGGTLKTGENTSGSQSFDIIVNGGELVVTGGSLETGTSFVGLSVMGNAPVKLSGGTFHGIGMGTNTDTVGRLLLNYGSTNAAEKHYAYYQGGEPVDLTKLERQYVLTDTVTVGECQHKGVTPTPNNDGTHSLKCPYCGYTGTPENCTYGDYKYNDTEHWKICEVCQGTTTPEAHYLRVTADEPVNGVTQNREACDYCDFTKNPFTVTVTVPSGLTYGNTVGIKPSYTISTEKTFDAVQLVLEDGNGHMEWMTGDTLPDNLSARSYKLYLSGGVSGNPMPVFLGRAYFTVNPAPLTADMVKLSPESVTYSGATQKPDITVKQGETTLVDGTDYDVTYSTDDFTNAGTVIVTIKGKGNYTGTVEKTYTIKKAVLKADGTGTANGTYGAKLSELSVTGLKAVIQGTATEVSGTWKLTGDTIPGVGDSGRYTATFTPASGAGNYETLTTQVTLNIERAAAPAPQEGTLYVQNNREQSYQYDLTQLLPALDNGKSYGTVNYTLGAVNISGDYYKDGAKITGTTLTLPIQKVEADKEGNIGEVSITITSGNYKDMSAVINVESVDKIPVTITGVSVAERKYNGKAIERTGTPKAVESNGSTAAISGDDYHYTWQTADGKDLSGAPKDAGSYQLTVSVNNDAYIGSSTISFVIDKASITITADSKTVSKGSAKPALTYTISGLASGEALAAEPTLSCNADMNTAGRYPITVSGAEVPDGNNYHTEITYVPGALTVTASSSGGSSGGGNGGGSGGNNNGNGSGSENNGDSGQGNSSDNGGGNTTPGVPSVPAVTDTNQGTDTETAKPGTGNTARPGTGTEPESGTAKEERPDIGIPFIKGEDGKIGWNVIRDEEEKAEEGSVINVDMNGTAVVPGDIFDSIKGRDITITFDMGNGIVWSVDGKSITTDKADDIDFTVRMGESTVPVEIVNNVTGERYSIQISLAYDGEFGFIVVLSVGIGEENAGYLASLYYYNEDTGELEFICADEVAQDGTVSFAFTHASDYVVVVDREVEEESGGIIEDAQPEETDGNGTVVPESPKTIQSQKTIWPWAVAITLVGTIAVIFIIIFLSKKKKADREES